MLHTSTTDRLAKRYAIPGIYAHGKLESRLGYDILCTEIPCKPKPGIWKTEVIDAHGTRIPAVAYVWENPNRSPGFFAGLVVDPRDTKAVVHAVKIYRIKPSMF